MLKKNNKLFIKQLSFIILNKFLNSKQHFIIEKNLDKKNFKIKILCKTSIYLHYDKKKIHFLLSGIITQQIDFIHNYINLFFKKTPYTTGLKSNSILCSLNHFPVVIKCNNILFMSLNNFELFFNFYKFLVFFQVVYSRVFLHLAFFFNQEVRVLGGNSKTLV